MKTNNAMERKEATPKFGNFLLNDGTYVSEAPKDLSAVRGIHLFNGVSLIDISAKSKMYNQADEWCMERGGVIPSTSALYFIRFHLDEINELRRKIGQEPLPEKFMAWSSDCKNIESAMRAFNFAVDMKSGDPGLLISSSPLLDDCSVAQTICICGEDHKQRTFL